MAESSRARDGKGNKTVDVEELLKNLNLQGEELNEVVLRKEEVRRWPTVKWLAARKILTRKSYSIQSVWNKMLAAWSPTYEVTFHDVEPNLFVMQAHCLGDWKKDHGGRPLIRPFCITILYHNLLLFIDIFHI
jgi:hypothetical protein